MIDSDNTLIAGHCRLEAAKLMQLTELPCIIIDGLSDAQKRALVIADNQLTLNADWDHDLLSLEIEHLKSVDFDIDLLGFDDQFIDDLLNDPIEGLTDEDEIPEIPDNPVTKKGDIWILGNHRLMCGDCMIKENIQLLTQNNHIDCVVTDPPYGLGGTDSEKNNFNRIR